MQMFQSKVIVPILDTDNYHYFDGGGGVQMAVRQSEPIVLDHLTAKLKEAVQEIEEIRGRKAAYFMINRLPPGCIVDKHTDTLKAFGQLERWHLPIATNDQAWYHDEINDKINMKVGTWYGPVPYWELHNAGNEGSSVRVHFIVDLGGVVQPRVINLGAENKMNFTGGSS